MMGGLGGGGVPGTGGGTTGGVGTSRSGIAHADNSKIRNSHAFSCGVRGAVPHVEGKGPPFPDEVK
jgi:hypothetical protein